MTTRRLQRYLWVMYALFLGNKNYSSWSLRPWVLLRELGIPFEERVLPFGDEAVWGPYRSWAPGGKVPVLVDGSRTVWDSMAIAEYLAERHLGVWPSEVDARAWARCAAAEMHAGFGRLRHVCTMNVGVRVRLHGVDPELRRDLDRLDRLWTEGLQRFGGPYLAGASFGAVDASFAPVAFRVRTYGLELSPGSASYAQRLLGRDAMRSWEAAALAEPWRDAPHEADLGRYGAVTNDLRGVGEK